MTTFTLQDMRDAMKAAADDVEPHMHRFAARVVENVRLAQEAGLDEEAAFAVLKEAIDRTFCISILIAAEKREMQS